MIRFLSTPSARRATQSGRPDRDRCVISIHALREEGDSSAASPRASPAYFYPRPPRGGRLFVLQKSQIFFDYFYPRPPRGGRREKSRTKFILEKFLSTPSARRATFLDTPSIPRDPRFLSTPSARRATEVLVQKLAAYEFLSTPSARRATIRESEYRREDRKFLSTPSARRATFARWACAYNLAKFLSTPSARRATHRHILSGDTLNNFYPRPPRGGRPAGR